MQMQAQNQGVKKKKTKRVKGTRHRVYQVWVLRICGDCQDSGKIDDESCQTCGKRWWHFYGMRADRDFCEWLFFTEVLWEHSDRSTTFTPPSLHYFFLGTQGSSGHSTQWL